MSILVFNDRNVDTVEILNILREKQLLRTVVRELVLKEELRLIEIEKATEESLMKEYRGKNNLHDDNVFKKYLASLHLSEDILINAILLPSKVVKYREDRWGPRAKSLYLKRKDSYDFITYKRLECKDADLMQEVYFRLKDREESWESLAQQFEPNNPKANPRIGPIKTRLIEPEVLRALKHAGKNIVTHPIVLKNSIIIAELEKITSSKFDDDIRLKVLQEEFEDWLTEAIEKSLKDLKFEESKS